MKTVTISFSVGKEITEEQVHELLCKTIHESDLAARDELAHQVYDIALRNTWLVTWINTDGRGNRDSGCSLIHFGTDVSRARKLYEELARDHARHYVRLCTIEESHRDDYEHNHDLDDILLAL